MAELLEMRKIEIDASKLDEELSTQASQYLFVAERAVEAEARYLAGKLQHETVVAKLDGIIRAKFDSEGKKMTEKIVENAIILDATYQSSAKLLGTLRTQKEAVRALRESWYMRKDLLIRMAINQRAEIEGLTGDVLKMSEAA